MPSSIIGAGIAAATGSSLAGAAASGITGLAMGGLGGGKGGGGGSGVAPFTNINSGGLYSGVDKNGMLYVTHNNKREALIKAIADKYLSQSQATRGLAPQFSALYDPAIAGTEDLMARVKPAYGDLTKSRVAAIQSGKQSSVSDLRSNLARRRVLGSSFADDTQKRVEAEYAQKEADARAASMLEEMDATAKLIDSNLQLKTQQLTGTKALLDKAFNLSLAADQTNLNEMNLLYNSAVGLLSNFQNVQQMNAEAQYKNSMTAGSTLSGALSSLGGVGSQIGSKIGSIFGGGSGGTSGGMFGKGYTNTSGGTISWL